MAKLDSILKRHFSGSLEKFLEELKNMIEKKIFSTRKRQIELFPHLDQFHSGARIMLIMKQLFCLTGDFSTIERILDSVSRILYIKKVRKRFLSI